MTCQETLEDLFSCIASLLASQLIPIIHLFHKHWQSCWSVPGTVLKIWVCLQGAFKSQKEHFPQFILILFSRFTALSSYLFSTLLCSHAGFPSGHIFPRKLAKTPLSIIVSCFSRDFSIPRVAGIPYYPNLDSGSWLFCTFSFCVKGMVRLSL